MRLPPHDAHTETSLRHLVRQRVSPGAARPGHAGPTALKPAGARDFDPLAATSPRSTAGSTAPRTPGPAATYHRSRAAHPRQLVHAARPLALLRAPVLRELREARTTQEGAAAEHRHLRHRRRRDLRHAEAPERRSTSRPARRPATARSTPRCRPAAQPRGHLQGLQTYVLTDKSHHRREGHRHHRHGGRHGPGHPRHADRHGGRQAALVGIIAKTVPPAELCNGKDDNCNGQIDEGVQQCAPCAPEHQRPTTAASASSLTAPTTPTTSRAAAAPPSTAPSRPATAWTTTATGRSTRASANACGGPCGCAVPAEKCNGLDDNCDGNIDEGRLARRRGRQVRQRPLGRLQPRRHPLCNAAGTGTVCSAPVVAGSAEICNSIDDNCDGHIDNRRECSRAWARPAATASGACQAGTIACVNGQLHCNTASMPKTEICNGLDDDCDGVVDNGIFPQTGALPLPRPDAGPGRRRRVQGRPSAVHGRARVRLRRLRAPLGAEICNGKDNDCDGMADNDRDCPSALAARRAPARTLPGRRVPLPERLQVRRQVLRPRALRRGPPARGPALRREHRPVRRRCAGVVCTAPASLHAGPLPRLLVAFGCQAGQLCWRVFAQTDNCAGSPAPEPYCANGNCVSLCDPAKCAAGQRCIERDLPPRQLRRLYCPPDSSAIPPTAPARRTLPGPQCPAGETCVSTPRAPRAYEESASRIPAPPSTAPATAAPALSPPMASAPASRRPAASRYHQRRPARRRRGGCSCAVGGGADEGWLGPVSGSAWSSPGAPRSWAPPASS